jgi:high-affinity Fe2+/Pb2+ permease
MLELIGMMAVAYGVMYYGGWWFEDLRNAWEDRKMERLASPGWYWDRKLRQFRRESV